jgi:hypothetical protein
MFCPDCGAEYREGFTLCSTCHVALVNGNPHLSEREFLKFVTVYETGDPAFIAFAKSIFQSEGIRYFCKGEALQELFAGGRLGTEFNPVVGSIAIQVDERDVGKARELLSQIEKGEFDRVETDTEYNQVETSESGSIRRHAYRGFLAGILIGASICAIGLVVYNYREMHRSGIAEYDSNKDSKPDLFYFYERGILAKSEEDRNFDGRIDTWNYYKDGIADHGASDNNFDGIVDTWFNFKNGILAQLEIDTNSDNKAEIIEHYTDGVLSEKLWLDESSHRIWKRALFNGGILKEESIDQDGDGTFDSKTYYDSSERPIKTLPLH